MESDPLELFKLQPAEKDPKLFSQTLLTWLSGLMTQSISSPLWCPESLSHSSSLSVTVGSKPTSGLAKAAMQTPRQDMVSIEDCQQFK